LLWFCVLHAATLTIVGASPIPPAVSAINAAVDYGLLGRCELERSTLGPDEALLSSLRLGMDASEYQDVECFLKGVGSEEAARHGRTIHDRLLMALEKDDAQALAAATSPWRQRPIEPLSVIPSADQTMFEPDGSVVFAGSLRGQRVYPEDLRQIERVQREEVDEWTFNFIGGSATLNGQEGQRVAEHLRQLNPRIEIVGLQDSIPANREENRNVLTGSGAVGQRVAVANASTDRPRVGTRDPREVTVPPRPRLVGGETYRPLRVPRWLIVAGVLVLGAGAAGVGSLVANNSGRGNQATSPPARQATAASSTTSIIRDLQARVIPAPAGYTAIEGCCWPNGFITPATLGSTDQNWTDFSASIGFLGGYDATYQSDTSDEVSIDIQLLRFSSPENALSDQQSESVLPAELPKQSPFPGIAGAFVAEGTQPFQGTYDDTVVARKGPVLMVIDYSTPTRGPTPTDLSAWAERQYARLLSDVP
jgi:hypothetical protein